jgi:ankyrin repeat protein
MSFRVSKLQSNQNVMSSGAGPLRHAPGSLIEACRNGDVESVRELLKTCGDTDKWYDTSTDGRTPLYVACFFGHLAVVQLLVEAGADMEKLSKTSNVSHQLVTRWCTPLCAACQQGHLEVVRLLVKAGADKDKARTDGCTPLFIASTLGHIEVVRLLVQVDADKEKGPDEYTPLFLASRKGHVEVVRLLVEAGAENDNAMANGYTPLFTASHKGHVEVVRLLVEAGADKNKAKPDGVFHGCTPLLIACEQGHIEVVRLLMEAGADKEKASTDGWTPLYCAALHGHDSVCMLLTFKGVITTTRTLDNNQTPADAAQIKGHASLAAHLRSSTGAHYLRCRGPSLEPRLLWNDTSQRQIEIMLDEMQAQWLARVVEGCAHARVGLALRGAFSGGLPTDMLLEIMGYVFGGTQAHLQSCISIQRVAVVHSNDQEQLLPSGIPTTLALVSHALALAVTPESQPNIDSAFDSSIAGTEAMYQLQTVLKQGSCTCEWLDTYFDFLQQRYLMDTLNANLQ